MSAIRRTRPAKSAFAGNPLVAAGLLAAAGAGAACRSTPPAGPLELPAGLSEAVDYHPGLVLGGGGRYADAGALDPDPAQALAVTCEVFYLEFQPATTLLPLPMRADLVVGLEALQPVLASSRLLMTAFAGDGAEAARLREEIGEGAAGRLAPAPPLRAALPVGATAMFRLRGEDLAPEMVDGAERQRSPRELTLHLGRAAEGLSVCLTARDVVPRLAAERAGNAPLQVDAPEREDLGEDLLQNELIALPDAPEVGGAPFVLCGPSPFRGEGRALAMFVSVAPAPGPDAPEAARRLHAEAVAACLERAAEFEAQAIERSAPGSIALAREKGLARVLDGLPQAADARVTLVALASAARASAALDLALSAPDPLVARFAGELARPGARPAGELPSDQLAWFLDRTALAVLAQALLEQSDPPVELEALLLARTGQLGRFPNAVLQALESSPGRPEFDALLRTENEGFLRDSDAGSRVRAFDWLAQRDRAPRGFDPLAGAEARRAALAAAEAAEADAAAPESGAGDSR